MRPGQSLLNFRILLLIEKLGSCLVDDDLMSALSFLAVGLAGTGIECQQSCLTLESIIGSNDVGRLEPYIHELSSKIYKTL
jgi:hypothetical protein